MLVCRCVYNTLRDYTDSVYMHVNLGRVVVRPFQSCLRGEESLLDVSTCSAESRQALAVCFGGADPESASLYRAEAEIPSLGPAAPRTSLLRLDRHSFIQQILSQCLFCVWHCSRHRSSCKGKERGVLALRNLLSDRRGRYLGW